MSLKVQNKFVRYAHISQAKSFLKSRGFYNCCRLLSRNNVDAVFKGTINSDRIENEYNILLHFPSLFPFKPPQIFPLDREIINNKHQDASYNNIPGKLCLYNATGTNDWHIGIQINEVFERAIDWFSKYETKLLGDELAPPELNRYHPDKLKTEILKFVIIEEFQHSESNNHDGRVKVFKNGKVLKVLFINHDDIKVFNEYDGIIYDLNQAYKNNIEVNWFEVKKEPFPILRTNMQLYNFIKKNCENLLYDNKELIIRIAHSKIIALRYHYNEIPQWVFYKNKMSFPEIKKGKPKGFTSYFAAFKAYGNKEIKLYSNIEYISYKAIFKRNRGQFSDLVNKKVLILGVGTIGSKIAELLTKSGVTSITIIDNETLQVGNICRHVLTIDSIYKSKVKELSKHLLKINPFLEINPIHGNVLSTDIVNYNIFSEHDLVISCIGDNNIETYLGRISSITKTKTVFARSYLLSSLGEIIYYNENYPCFSCLKHFIESTKNSIVPKIPSIPFKDNFDYDYECGTPYIPAAAIDIEYISLMATQLIIQI